VASINNITGKRFIELLSVDSTNNYAMQQVQKGTAMNGDAYFAFEQTAGKGQFNKQWLTAKGENIILSLVLDTRKLPLSRQFILNMAAALSARQLFNKYTTEKVKIKWPNDIYCNDRKAAGILIENVIRGKKWQFAILGFGININQTAFSNVLRNPVSLKQITGNTYNVVELAKELCALLEENIKPLFAGDANTILKNYNLYLYKRNELAEFKQGSTKFSGIVKKADESGNLIIDTGIEKAYQSGRLEWLL
jgi:BirA family transcriptional regulator, biotin operon repressor / biotin---[acetyl-CoA-carboxylase] ligase